APGTHTDRVVAVGKGDGAASQIEQGRGEPPRQDLGEHKGESDEQKDRAAEAQAVVAQERQNRERGGRGVGDACNLSVHQYRVSHIQRYPATFGDAGRGTAASVERLRHLGRLRVACAHTVRAGRVNERLALVVQDSDVRSDTGTDAGELL